MDFYSFVNSNAIRDHLRSINYEFNSLEVAWLIYSCKKLTYQQKKEAWAELMKLLPDTLVSSRRAGEYWKTIYELIPLYIDCVDRSIDEFYKVYSDQEYVYMYRYLYGKDGCWSEEFETAYRSLDKCLEAFKDEYLQVDFVSRKGELGTGLVKYELKKQSLNDPEKSISITFSSDDQIMDIGVDSINEIDNYVGWGFDSFWFDFPTPFKKGDIVWDPKPHHMIKWECDGPFVLEGLITWESEERKNNCGDVADMNGSGYFLNPDGTIYQEVMFNYMNLEYYDKPLANNERILKALSQYLKEEIPLDFLLCVYRRTLLDEAANDIMLSSWYPQVWVEGAGLPYRRK